MRHLVPTSEHISQMRGRLRGEELCPGLPGYSWPCAHELARPRALWSLGLWGKQAVVRGRAGACCK